jgi:hypothetical protein
LRYNSPNKYTSGQSIRWDVDEVRYLAAYWDVDYRPDLVRQAFGAWQGRAP